MKNILFWAGLLVATFWDEVLLASIKPEKTKKQQQFLETGETAQYFIGAVEDELVTLLKGIFTVKKVVKSKSIFPKTDEWNNVSIYEINGGVKEGRMTLFIEQKGYYYKEIFYTVYIANGYYNDWYDKISYKLFKENDVYQYNGDKIEILFGIWRKEILNWHRDELYDKVENFEQIVQIAETDIELAFLLLSGVPNIKEILS